MTDFKEPEYTPITDYQTAMDKIDELISRTILLAFRKTNCNYNGELYGDDSDEEILESFKAIRDFLITSLK